MELGRTLFLARFPDGALYGTGPQVETGSGCVPGGIIAYERREMARQVAEVIRGEVIARSFLFVLTRSQEKKVTLFLRHSDGRTGVIRETVSEKNVYKAVKIEGDEREALVELAVYQRGGDEMP